MAKGKIKAETLLRKVQKGSVTKLSDEARSKIPGFNFDDHGRIQIFRKREIVQPYLHPIDSRLVNDQIEKTVKTNLRNLDPNIETEYSKLLPSHLVNDLYSLYFNPTQKMKFEGLNKTNKVKFDILDNINNSLIKIVTNNSHIGSYVYTEEISKYLYKKFMELPPEQREQLKQALQNCNQGSDGEEGDNEQDGEGQGRGSGKGDKNGKKGQRSDKDQNFGGRQDSESKEDSVRDPNNSARGGANNSFGKPPEKDKDQAAADKMAKDLEKMVQDLKNHLNSKQSQKDLEKAFKEAEQKMDKLKEIGVDMDNDEEMPEEEKKEIIRNLNNLDSIRRSLSSLNTSKDKIMKAVNKILNGTTNYFSQKCIQNDVELFEADQILDINGIELLHPFFRKSRLLDLSITERKYIGKFDLYIDCSGSMGAGCGGDLQGVTRIDLAKSLALQMKELGILGDLYEFEDYPKKISNTDISILMMSAGGGTNIENVMKSILKSGNNSVVLSDGESYVQSYSHKALFIGIGTDFHYFKHDNGIGSKFVENSQCIYYNGKEFVETFPLEKKK